MPVCPSCNHETAETARFCPTCGAALEPPGGAPGVRKTVSIVFCDLVGSTALGEATDPEALRALLSRYFDWMRGIVESHGGSVEKFIGDAVLAVFGVPVTHEDDALRACRAAAEMRDALPDLGIEGRIGVNTGPVMTGVSPSQTTTGEEQGLVTGDAVNVAARLEQAAGQGEVLIGAETLALVGAAVEVGEQQLLELKGKSEPVAAYQLVAVHDTGERSHASRFVGREPELQQLLDAWETALADSRCMLVTVVGDPGVGKSRLVAEALANVEARVARGRCLAYGEGITYWPIVEVVKQLGALPDDEAAAQAIRSLLGEQNDVRSGTDEIAWAFRKLLEQQAPLVVCLDDIQWGEQTFLDLVESVALLSTGAPLLLVCMARPELIDRRPEWPVTLRLDPLPEREATDLIGDAVAQETREQIVRVSGGNPLFLTEMLALANDSGKVEVPPTLRAVLAARLDQLGEPERRVLERGAVEGELFHRGAVQALGPDEREVTPRLAALVRRGLVRPDQPQLPRQDAYRFRHLLVRDAAYDALPKATRADLHRSFATWLEEHGRSLVELDEILGYHLEQAARYLEELGQSDPEIFLAAAEHLAAAGRRALGRGDYRAAAGLLERALTLTRPYELDIHLELDLAWVAEPSKRERLLEAVVERAVATGDARAESLARLAKAKARFETRKASPDEVERLANETIRLVESANDHRGLVEAWSALSELAHARCQFEEVTHASEQLMRHSRLAGWHSDDRSFFGEALILGPRPASEALLALEKRLSEQGDRDPATQAVLLAMLDRFAEAWALARGESERLRELGRPLHASIPLLYVAEFADDHETAVRELRFMCDRLEFTGHYLGLSTYAPMLARHLCALGQFDEAEPFAHQGQELGDPQDAATQTIWRQAQALVLAHQGEYTDAERLVREAIAIDAQTDQLWEAGNTYCVLADVLEAAGRAEEVAAALEQALDRYERKEIIPLARRVRSRLKALEHA